MHSFLFYPGLYRHVRTNSYIDYSVQDSHGRTASCGLENVLMLAATDGDVE